MAEHDDAAGSAIGKLERLAVLDDDDRNAIAALPFAIKRVPAGHYLVREGHEATECCVLMSGYVRRHKTTGSGGRQILSFHIPGDMLDLQHLLIARADHDVQTMTAATLGCVSCTALKTLARERPAVGAALWRDTLVDAAIFREWVLNAGRRDARSRIAHMLCEFAARRAAAGLGPPERFELPMTQEEIADATGLTPVHVNRMLQALRVEGAIASDKRHVEIVDWQRLRRIAGFDPAYLHAAA